MSSIKHGLKNKIGLITMPGSKAGMVPLLNLVDIITSLSETIYVLTGGLPYARLKQDYNTKCTVLEVNHRKRSNPFARAFFYIVTQLQVSKDIVALRERVNLWIFFMGGSGLILPMIVAKLFQKKILLITTGSSVNIARETKDVLMKPTEWLIDLSYELPDKIVVYAPSLIKDLSLEKHSRKIIVASRHYVDLNVFKVTKTIEERRNIIGFVGRLSQEKGVLNFVDAIPTILERANDASFLIVGAGPLFESTRKKVADNHLGDKVEMKGWIEHENLPVCLNELRLLVLPSATEGLPNIILESMACGTPVLVTLVGGLVDLVKDEKNGFVTQTNSASCLAKNVIRALAYPNIKSIVSEAHMLIENEFIFNRAVERFRDILTELSEDAKTSSD